MILDTTFKYKQYDRTDTERGRYYKITESMSLPSITTILSATSDKTYLIDWRKAVGDVEADRIVKISTDVGSAMHQNLENHIHGLPFAGNVMSQTLAKLIVKKGFCQIQKVYGTEVPLYLNGLYAGTTDLVASINDKVVIIDYKNSREMKIESQITDYYLQLVAYSMAHNEMYGTDIDTGYIFMASQTGKYKEFKLDSVDFLKFKELWLDRVEKFYSMP